MSDNILLHPFTANFSLFICLLIKPLGKSISFVQSRTHMVGMFSFFYNIEKLSQSNQRNCKMHEHH